jgi:hypothetical protein
MLLLLVHSKARAFVCLRQPSHFLFAWPKRKITKEKGHPASAPDGHPVHQVRGRATGFVDSTSCAGEKLAGIPAGHPAGFPTPARRCRGAPVKQRAIVARTVHKSQVKSFPLTPTLSPGVAGGEGAGAVAQRCCSASASAFAFAVLKSAGHDGPLLYRGPCAAVRRGRQAAQRESTGMSTPFRQGRMPCRKARPRLTDLLGRMPNKRQAGWPFSLVTFSLATQRESDSVAAGDRPLFALNAASAKASRTGCAPTDAVRKLSAAAAANHATEPRP